MGNVFEVFHVKGILEIETGVNDMPFMTCNPGSGKWVCFNFLAQGNEMGEPEMQFIWAPFLRRHLTCDICNKDKIG